MTEIKSKENSKERKKRMWVSREGRIPTETGDVSLSFIGYSTKASRYGTVQELCA